MTPARAAEVLRYKKLVGLDDWDLALNMGAEALEFCEWLLALDGDGMMKLHDVMDQWNAEDSFLDYARAEWEKGRKG
jgi:hypothetical protein